MNNIAELQRQLSNLIRIGLVIEINHPAALARVQTGENETDWLPWAEQNAAEIYTSNPPKKGESWVILSPSGELEQGVLALRLTSVENPHLINDGSEKKIQYPDGTEIGYNHAKHELTVNIPENGQLNITVNGPVNVSAPQINFGEESALEPSVLGDKLAAAMEMLIQQINASQVIGNLGAPTSAIQAVVPVKVPNLLSGGNAYSKKNRNQ